ncbi:MAG: carbohydrate ABC transporter substrate-binding protein [Clostridia bacterium]|nr:carbohydrate ABC transporter substrate-binding protein [Clostridia bacterium]
MKRFFSLFLSLLLMLGLTACGDTQTPPDDGAKVLTLPTYMAGENVGAVFFLPQVQRFNQANAGRYRIEVQEVPQAAYAEKIKQLAQQNRLPALIHAPASGGIDVQWFNQIALPNGMAYDLTSFLAANPDLAALCIPESLEFCTREGALVCMPMIATRPMGLFYNSAIYSPAADIRDMSITDFAASLGENKIAFQTADNGWTTALFLSALVAQTEEGVQLLRTHIDDKLYDYTSPTIVNAVEQLRALFDTAAVSGSLGAAYADAANAFMSGRAAVIANGPWMSSEFEADASDKWSGSFSGENVRADFFPGNIAIANTAYYGDFWVSANATEDEREVALAFLKFRNSPAEIEAYLLAEGGSAPYLNYSAEFLEEQRKTQVLADLSDAAGEDTVYVPSILDVMPSSVADAEFGRLLPKLIDGTLSGAEFCAELTRKAEATRS